MFPVLKREKSNLSGFHVDRTVIGIRGTRDIDGIARISECNAGHGFHGDFNIAGGEFKFALIDFPVELQLVHVIADFHIAVFPLDIDAAFGG